MSWLSTWTLSAAFGADLDRPAVKKRAHSGYARYAHLFPEDPYAYRYEPRGYYPYYRSDYWRPAKYVLYRNRVHYNVWNTRPPHFRYLPELGLSGARVAAQGLARLPSRPSPALALVGAAAKHR